MFSLHMLKCHISLPMANLGRDKVFMATPLKKIVIHLFYTVGAQLMQYIHHVLIRGNLII